MTDTFIGREKYLSFFKKSIFSPEFSGPISYSLIGPNNIGKTRLVSKLIDDFRKDLPENTYVFYTSLSEIPRMNTPSDFWLFWIMLIRRFAKDITADKLISLATDKEKDEIVNNILELYDFYCGKEAIDSFKDDPIFFGADPRNNHFSLLEGYDKLGIRIVLAIDEFDLAADLCSLTGTFFEQLFQLTSKGGCRLNLAIVLISRRSTATIAHHMKAGSNFSDGFPTKALTGFSNAELEEYFSLYDSLPCGALSENVKAEIIEHCGRNPGLLMNTYREISFDFTVPVSLVDIRHLFSTQGNFLTVCYDRMIDLMESELDRSGKNFLSAFSQAFIGPAYSNDLKSQIDKMSNFGFITKLDLSTEQSDIYTLSGITEAPGSYGVFRGKTQDSIYEPLSPKFVEYFKQTTADKLDDELTKMLNKAERLVRRQILEAYKRVHGNNAAAELLSFATSNIHASKETYLLKLEENKNNNNGTARGLEYTILDVLSFDEYYKYIANDWTSGFAASYCSFVTLPELCDDLHFLTISRNCWAHLNFEVLDELGVKRLRTICQKLIDDLSFLERERVAGTVGPDSLEIGQMVRITNIKRANGRLEGYYINTYHRCAISPNSYQSAGISDADLLGNSANVVIKGFNSANCRYDTDFVATI